MLTKRKTAEISPTKRSNRTLKPSTRAQSLLYLVNILKHPALWLYALLVKRWSGSRSIANESRSSSYLPQESGFQWVDNWTAHHSANAGRLGRKGPPPCDSRPSCGVEVGAKSTPSKTFRAIGQHHLLLFPDLPSHSNRHGPRSSKVKHQE